MRVSRKSSKDALNLCKHCGRLPKLYRVEAVFEVPFAVYYQVICKCGIRTKFYRTKSGAVKCWNREVKSDGN